MGTNQHNPAFRFCPVCGGKLMKGHVKEAGMERSICSVCNYIFYLDPKVVACTIVEDRGKIVLIKRDINPEKGMWVLPGGYVDRGEAVKDAAARETEEECGIRVHIRDLLGVYSYTGEVPVVIVYRACPVSGNLEAGDETQEACWFGKQEIPWNGLAFRSTTEALNNYFAVA